MLRWRITKQPDPYGPLHVGFLGSIPVASIEDEHRVAVEYEQSEADRFRLSFSLPPKSWQAWWEDSTLDGYRSEFMKLDKAKATAERIVSRWLKDARLRATR